MLDIVTGEMPPAAKKMLWKAHRLNWRSETGAALLRDGVCYAWAGLDKVGDGEYYCFLVRDFNNVFSDIPKERWTEIQNWGTYEIFNWMFNELKASRVYTERREHSTRVVPATERMGNGEWKEHTWECKAEDVVLTQVRKPDFV